jgi:hypothetical protein
MPENIREILLNKEVIAVDQDPMGLQGIKVWDNGKGLGVYSKVLKGNETRAVALFNRTNHGETITANWRDTGLTQGGAAVRDLWKHSDLGVYPVGYKAFVPSHGVVMLKIVGKSNLR